ncbi:MAG: hypothetical protein LBH04_06800 [Tannerellaceae bacterium]|jgi:hypothetical protein|nr:hypothetical protein [Tannerellaceae bacterium]
MSKDVANIFKDVTNTFKDVANIFKDVANMSGHLPSAKLEITMFALKKEIFFVCLSSTLALRDTWNGGLRGVSACG